MNREFIYFISFFYKVKNRFYNIVASLIEQKKITLDWRSVKIINAKYISVGNNFSAGQGLWLHAITVDSKLIIGDNINISDWTHIAALDCVVIESGCLIGSHVLITDHSHGSTSDLRSNYNVMPNQRPLLSKGPVHIGKNVWIGDGVVILPNVNIGEGAIIAANSVVNRSVPPYSIVAGIPAKVIRK